MSHLIGIDLGTSSVKCALLNAETLATIAISSREYALNYPQPGFVEQSPEEWFDKTIEALAELIQKTGIHTIQGIGFSGQMHGTVLLDSKKEVLNPAIIWADSRSGEILDELIDTVGYNRYIQTTGTGPATGFMGATLLWLKYNRPKLLEKTQYVLLPKDYVRYRLTGEIATDASDAAGTGIFDIHKAQWADKIIEKCGFPRSIFPPILNAYDIAGYLREDVARRIGLEPRIPLVTGCADQAAQAVGNGIFSEGRMSITVGSGGQIFVPIKASASLLRTDDRIHVFNHATGGWYALGAILSAGLALRWLRDVLKLTNRENAYAHLAESAKIVPTGADGLLFLPYLNGTRTPYMNPSATGSFIGLTSRHTQGHLVRAVMEGVAFAIRGAYEACISVVDNDIESIIGAGGGMTGELWRQIIVNVLNQPVYHSNRTEQASSGAALLAGIGLNLFGDSLPDNLTYLENQLSNYDFIIEPSDNHAVYEERYAIFKELYPLLN